MDFHLKRLQELKKPRQSTASLRGGCSCIVAMRSTAEIPGSRVWDGPLQLMLWMLAQFNRFSQGPFQLMCWRGSGIWAKALAADAHDADLVPEFGQRPVLLMLMMLARFRNGGKGHCS